MLNQLLETNYSGLPEWITASFPVIRIILLIAIALAALCLIVLIMMSESNPEGGSNVIIGTNDSFYSQNQSSTKEGRLKKAITITAIVIVSIAILFFVSYIIYPVGI